MKILRVGDYHAQVSNLDDCNALLDFIVKTAKKEKVDRIELMGDTFHTHAVKRVEVEYFVKDMLIKLAEVCEVIVLIGNHDMILGKSKHAGKHALESFKDISGVTIVDYPVIIGEIGYLPYMSNSKELSNAADGLFQQGATEMLVGHLTVDGAKYENGFYSEEGIPMEIIPQKAIISGHVHKSGQIGKCFYTGTPKWDSMNSAGQDKGIWLFNHNKNGSVKSKKLFSTEDVVTPIYKIEMEEKDEKTITIPNRGIIYLTAKGKSSWLKKIKKKYLGLVRFKGISTDVRKTKVSKGEAGEFKDFLKNFKLTKGVKRKEISEYLQEVGNV